MRLLTAVTVAAVMVLAFGLSAPGAQVARTTADLPLSEVREREIIIELDPARGVKSVSAFCAAEGLEHRRTRALSYATYEVVRVPEGADYHQVLAALESDPRAKTVGPNVRKHVSETTLNDPLLFNGAVDLFQGLGKPYVLNDQWALLMTGCLEAWDGSTGSSNVVVAIIDTGVNFDHEDLKNRYWTNPVEAAGQDGVDDDSNGYVDDVRGYDFYEISAGGDDNDPTDPSGDAISHGNATSSIVAAQGGNQLGIAGVAGGGSPAGGVRIMALRVGTNADIGVDAEIAAIDYAAAMGAKVISMSFGGKSGGPPEENAIDRAWDAGAYIVAASGNKNQGNQSNGEDLIDLPAGFQNCVAVGATTIFPTQTISASTDVVEETLGQYSKIGPETEVTAPGTHILCAMKDDTSYSSLANQFTGTSAATPLVAGLAALLWSADYEINGHFTRNNQAIRTIIRDTAVDLGTQGWDEEFGFGRIDMEAAMDVILPGLSGDTNNDGAVDENDVQPIIDHFGAKVGDDNYDPQVDANGDGVIDELDLFVVGRHFGDTE